MRIRQQLEDIADSDVRDAALLANLGYKQEFTRDFTPFEVFGLGFSIIGVVPSVTSVLPYSLPYGGTVAMVWGWAICSIFLMFIALAVAELGSSAPTSGGLYYWTFHFSSPRHRKLLSWIVGYTNTIAYISAAAAVDWGCSVQIMAAVTMGSDLRFVPSPAQIYGVYCALLVCHAVVASRATKTIARLQSVYILVNIALCLAIIIGLPAATPPEFRNTAKYAFGHSENMTSWPNGFAFILSFLAPLWVVGGFDSSVHISEEVRNANIAIPWAILCAAGLGSVLGWAMIVALAFSMGTDLPSILGSPIGQPVATIFYNSFGRRGTLSLWSFIILVQFMMGTSILTAASRQVFAFSRDGALPFARFLYHIDKRTNTPVNCVWASAFSAGLLALICLAGPAASGAIFTLGVVCQYTSLSIPIAARHLGGKEFTPGPFHLGKCGKPVAAVAVTWMTFMAIVLLFPSVPEVDTQTMNYTVIVLGGVLMLSLAYYYFPVHGGAYWFAGPVSTVARMECVAQ
ncbi:GABA-specific high-affinity permease [Pleurotus ostreatus]|uniref:GABA-specific high-affinity permease n=1 Tax=Pleurotus ostreatus TaxID=5322 RepID=A0A8H6ZX17_PLEOS|nr:GABA-specific high-affinity permease [Pleurotus ostreatus]KAF7430212.1 GABA-specific high-affinity permease [Pleurotus ostreatus]